MKAQPKPRLTVAQVNNKVDHLIELMENLLTPADKPVTVKPKAEVIHKTGNFKVTENFKQRWEIQFPRAVKLAESKGTNVILSAIRKGNQLQCWYYQQGKKNVPANEVRLAVINSSGKIEALNHGVKALVA